MGRKVIVFIHGLESGVHGSKARYLKRNFPNVIVPDLEMSALSLFKRNSFLRNMGNFQASLDGCAEAVMADIKLHTLKTDDIILVGSSWGGLVALHLVATRKVSACHTLLLAPALSAVGIPARCWPKVMPDDLPSAPRSIDVIHGDCDNTIPLKSSLDLEERFPSQVKVTKVAGGDHRLSNYLINPSKRHPEGALVAILENDCRAERILPGGTVKPANTGATLSDFRNFHGMLISPSRATLCIDQFAGGKVLFMPGGTPAKHYRKYLFLGKFITRFNYYAMTLYSFTMLSSLLSCTQFLAAEENLLDGLDFKKAGDFPEDVLPALGKDAAKHLAVVRYFSYNFRIPGLKVKMWHVHNKKTGVIHLLEIFNLKVVSPLTVFLLVVGLAFLRPWLLEAASGSPTEL
jgi:predicted esterase